ncbi:hypothetical protein [Brumicola pallidula]|uniref:hypothetical protein n=1 Tax=Brumicola pallidula TaxID=56807 RepID=UPI0002D90F1C|nr:hypothetical protein [Glaciecola pallidula]
MLRARVSVQSWLSLLAALLIFGDYAISVFTIDANVLNPDEMIEVAMHNLSSAVLLIIMVEIIFQSLIAAGRRNKIEFDGDERDKLISLTSNNSGYWVLSIGGIITLGQLILSHVSGMQFSLEEHTNIPMFEMHLLLFSFIVAEIVRFSHQIYLYRKDAV